MSLYWLCYLYYSPLASSTTIDHQDRDQNRADSSGLCTYKTCSSFRHRGIFNQFHDQRDVQCSFTAFSSRNRTATHRLHMPKLMQLMQLNWVYRLFWNANFSSACQLTFLMHQCFSGSVILQRGAWAPVSNSKWTDRVASWGLQSAWCESSCKSNFVLANDSSTLAELKFNVKWSFVFFSDGVFQLETVNWWSVSLGTGFVSLNNLTDVTKTRYDLIPVEQILKNFRSRFKVLEYGIHYRSTSKMPRLLLYSSVRSNHF